MTSVPNIVSFGEILFDLIEGEPHLGGAPLNLAVQLKRLGADASIISAVGRDRLGDAVFSALEQYGMSSQYVRRCDYPTGTVSVTLDAEKVPRYDFLDNCAYDHISTEYRGKPDLFCYGTLSQRSEESRATLHRLWNELDTTFFYDVNLRQDFYTREVLEHSMRQCDVLKLNDEELEIVGRMEGTAEGTAEERCRELMGKYGLRMLILTCGTRGSYVFAQEGTSFAETPQVEVADTVGAGDSFTATFVASLLQGKDVRTAHLRATRVAAYVCSQEGAMPKLPEELRAGD